MTDYMRVKHKATKHESTIPAYRFDGERHAELKKDATDVNGLPLPAKPYTKPAPAADLAPRENGHQADTKKEND